MLFHRTQLAALALIAMAGTSPAFAQAAAPAPQAAPAPPAAGGAAAKTGPDSDDAFMTGLRRIGVMAGQVVQCTAEADRQKPITDSMDLANQIALHFGLSAAFNFTGAVGYGAGSPFDKAGCAQANAGWNEIKQKYLHR